MANRIVLYDGGKNPTLVGTADGQVPTWNNTTQTWTAQAGGGGSGTVTGVTAGTGLNVGAGPGGTITTSGTLNLANTAVTPASYGTTAAKTASFTVDAQGRLTAASETDIAIAASQVTSGTFSLSQVAGPTGIGFGVTSATGVWAAASISGTDKLVGFNGTTPSAITIGSGLSLTGGTLSATGGGTVTSVTSTSALLTVANGTTTPALTVNTGTTSSTVAIGDDTRFNPGPSGAGKIPYDNGTGYSAAAAGTSTQVLIGGEAPSFGAVNLATMVTGSLPATSVSQNPYDFGGEFPGTPQVGEECMHYIACRAFTLPAGTSGKAYCVGAATATTTFTVYLNEVTSIGTIVYTNGVKAGTLTITSLQSVAIGDRIMVKADTTSLNGIDTPFWQFFAYT